MGTYYLSIWPLPVYIRLFIYAGYIAKLIHHTTHPPHSLSIIIPECHGLNQYRSLFIDNHLSGVLGGIIDGKNIITVHSDALHTIPDGTGHYTITSIVLTTRSGDSIAVVATTGEREREGGERGREGRRERRRERGREGRREKMKMNTLKSKHKQAMFIHTLHTSKTM